MQVPASVGHSFAARAIGCCAPLLALSAFWSAPAGAAVIETVSISNTYGFAFGSESTPTVRQGRSTETFYNATKSISEQSELGLNYTATAGSDGFFFLHDNYCVGSCSTFSKTVITFTLTNDNESSVDLRFDSQITPGHLARIAGGSAQGSFTFDVDQSFGESSFNLYNATGDVNSDGIFLETGDLVFNGLQSITDPDGRWEVLDWSTTNLNIALMTIGAGETATLTYTATYQVSGGSSCALVTDCAGVQVVFGDPRNNGGVDFLSDNFDDTIYPVIGRDYASSFIPIQVVSADAPLPPTPGVLPRFNYGPLFEPRVLGVPEPATWAMLIGGFGMIGGAMRRRRHARPAVC